MAELKPYIISEGNCPNHGRFRCMTPQRESHALCPACGYGPVPLAVMGRGQTRRALPCYEATDKIFLRLDHSLASTTENSPNKFNSAPGRTTFPRRQELLQQLAQALGKVTITVECKTHALAVKERHGMHALCRRRAMDIESRVEGCTLFITRTFPHEAQIEAEARENSALLAKRGVRA